MNNLKNIGKWVLGWILSLRFFPKKNEYYWLVYGHIGEAVYSLSLIHNFKRLKGINHITIVTKRPYDGIAELYSDELDGIIVLNERNITCIDFYARSRVKFHNNILGAGWHWDDNTNAKDVQGVYMPGYQYKVQCLGVPYTTKHSKISNPIKEEDPELQKIIKKYNIQKSNAVVLIPFAQSAKELERAYWEKIANILLKFGYQVFTNVKSNEEKPINNTIPIIVPLKYANAVFEYAGSCIAIRCGLTDLLAVGNTKMEVLYKIENDVDKALSIVWKIKLGEDNALNENAWDFTDKKSYETYLSHITEKYNR